MFDRFNCFGIPMGNTGCQMGGWFRKEINTVDDLRGLKFRNSVASPAMSSAELAECPSRSPPATFILRSKRGTIDAVEWIGPYDDERLGFYKIAKYYYYPAWWEGSANAHTLVNLEKWNSLPKHYQATLLAAARDAGQMDDWQIRRRRTPPL